MDKYLCWFVSSPGDRTVIVASKRVPKGYLGIAGIDELMSHLEIALEKPQVGSKITILVKSLTEKQMMAIPCADD